MREARKSSWPILLLAVGLLAGGAAAGYYWVLQDQAAAAGPGTSIPEPGPLFEVGTLMTNLNEGDPTTYVRVDLQLEAEDESVIRRLVSREAAVRDALLGVLRDKRREDLEGLEGMNATGRQMRMRLNQMLGGGIRRVYFSEFIIQ